MKKIEEEKKKFARTNTLHAFKPKSNIKSAEKQILVNADMAVAATMQIGEGDSGILSTLLTVMLQI